MSSILHDSPYFFGFWDVTLRFLYSLPGHTFLVHWLLLLSLILQGTVLSWLSFYGSTFVLCNLMVLSNGHPCSKLISCPGVLSHWTLEILGLLSRQKLDGPVWVNVSKAFSKRNFLLKRQRVSSSVSVSVYVSVCTRVHVSLCFSASVCFSLCLCLSLLSFSLSDMNEEFYSSDLSHAELHWRIQNALVHITKKRKCTHHWSVGRINPEVCIWAAS